MIEPNTTLLRRTIEAAYNDGAIDLAEYHQALDYMYSLEDRVNWKDFHWNDDDEED